MTRSSTLERPTDEDRLTQRDSDRERRLEMPRPHPSAEDIFRRYLSYQTVKKLLDNAGIHDWPPERQRVTILFADIRGFTALSDILDPYVAFELLDDYFEAMIAVIEEHGGTIDKFMGDGIMALYGAPESLDGQEERAVRTALAMQARLHNLREKWAHQGKLTFKIGIGIHTGDVLSGTIGSDLRADFAVIGRDVNIAARLEGLTKDVAADILISGETYDKVADLVHAQLLGHREIRGIRHPVMIYAVTGLREGAASE